MRVRLTDGYEGTRCLISRAELAITGIEESSLEQRAGCRTQDAHDGQANGDREHAEREAQVLADRPHSSGRRGVVSTITHGQKTISIVISRSGSPVTAPRMPASAIAAGV